MDHTNAIYAEVQPRSENDYVMDVQKNECYQNPTVIPTFKQPFRPVEKTSSSKKTVVVLGLIFATLVLVLGGVAAATVYALVEIANLKVAISLDEAASLQQTSKLEMLLTQELDSRIQQLQDSHNSTVQRLNILEDVAEMNATIFYQQVIQEISAASTRLTASISALQQQSAQNDNVLDARLDSHISSTNTLHQQLTSSIAVVNSVLSQISNSCDGLPSSLPAGYYYLLSSTGSAVRQYCPSITSRCGQTGRWRSVANLDMTRANSQCPAELILHRNFSKTLCIRHSDSSGCSSVQLPTNTAYRSVCGFIKAYQFGQPEAFVSSSSIDSTYVDGVSITHGSPRQHIWTFAATGNEETSSHGCPCMGGSDSRPAFVGNDYFCDTGTSTGNGAVFYGDDPLWDGAGCGPTNNCCSFNTPPWFYKELPQYTTDDIELRVCCNQERSNEDISIEVVTMYVK